MVVFVIFRFLYKVKFATSISAYHIKFLVYIYHIKIGKMRCINVLLFLKQCCVE